MMPISLARRARIAVAAAAIVLACLPTVATASPPFSGLVIFGDSLSDPGNVAAVLTPPQLAAGAAQVITGNTYIPGLPYASGQFSNGDVWAIGFAGMLSLTPAGNSYLSGGGNFAWGGARTSTNGATPSLLSQFGSYMTLTGNTASPTALYVVAGGGNDGRDAVQLAAANPAQTAAIIGAAATLYATSTMSIVNGLRSAGANNIIVWNTPNLGLAPAITAFGPQLAGLGTLVAGSMNAAMQGALAPVSLAAPGVKLFDDFSLLSAAVANPAGYGLSNVTDACGNPLAGCNLATSLFWDGIHPTAAGHSLLSQQMFALAVPEPSAVLMMAAGVLLLIGLGRRRRA